MSYLFYTILVIFAFLPSLIWLVFFLRKDAHPESKKMILEIFLYGVLVALPALFIEKGALQFIKDYIPENSTLFLFLKIFVGVALIEEFMKYLVFKIKVSPSPEFDEPIDAMIYMIIIALGFAAFENFLILLGLDFLSLPLFIKDAFLLSLFRFVSAIFLHALVSGLFGYYLALSMIKKQNKEIFFIRGLLLATLLHGLYNLSIITMVDSLKGIQEGFKDATFTFLVFTILLFSILIGLSLFVNFALKKLGKIKKFYD
jgi:RsiW-degrading membrane proteinase PrsW (M82 family)